LDNNLTSEYISNTTNPEDLSNILNTGGYEPNYFSMLFGLVVVIGLIYLTAILYKKLTKIKIDNSQNEEHKIEIISSTSLGQNKNLYVIKVDSTYSLIGATQNNITHIKDIGEANEN
jgi:flagellar biosynthetic protein FliO